MAIDWKLYERDVNRWYIDEGKTANEVIQLLHDNHNLTVTTRQFKVKFGGCKKISSKEWSILIPKIRQREAEGLLSVIYVCGKAVKQDSMARSMRRYSKLCGSGSQSGTAIDLGIDTIGQHRIEIRTLSQSGSELPSHETTAETHLYHEEDDTSRLQNDGPDIDEEFGLVNMDIELDTAICLSPSTFLGGLGQLAPNPSQMLSFGDTSERLMESDEAMLSGYQWAIRSPSSGPASWFPFRHAFTSFWDLPEISSFTLQGCQVLATARQLGSFVPDHGRNELLQKFNLGTAQTEVLTPVIQSIKELLTPPKSPDAHMNAGYKAQLHFSPNLLDIADGLSLAQALSVIVYMVSNNLLGENENYRLIYWILKRDHAPELLAFSQLPAVNHLAFGSEFLRAISKTESRFIRRDGVEAMTLIGTFVSSSEFLSLVKSHREDLMGPLGMTLFRLAVKTDSMELAKLLLSQGVDLRSDSEPLSDLRHSDWKLLDLAVFWRRHSMLELIISHGVDVNQNHAKGRNRPVRLAVENGDHFTVRTLLDAGALVPDGILFEPVSSRDLDIHALLRKSLRHDPEFLYWELVMAAEKGNGELSKVSLAYDIVSQQVLERAFVRAVEEAKLAAIGTFLRRGTDPNVGMAAFHGQINSFKMNGSLLADIIYFLVQAGAQLSDETALSVHRSLASEGPPSEDGTRLLRVLLQLGYDKAWVRQCLLTSYAEERSMFDCDACIDGGALINGYDINGQSALQTATNSGCLFLVQHLISRGADPNLPQSSNHPNGETVLYSALARGHWEVVAYLIDSGADITAKATTTGATLLEGVVVGSSQRSRFNGKETALKMHFRNLLALGAPVHRPNSTDSFLLHGLLNSGEVDCLELALKAGAQIEGKYDGMTPIQLAVLQKDTDAMQLLLQHGANIDGCPSSLCSHTALPQMPSPKPPRPHPAVGFEEALKDKISRHSLSSGFQIGVFADKKPYFPHSPIQLASSYHDPDLGIVEFLLREGADFNAPAAEWHGRTALQGATSSEKASMEVVKLLLDRGADVNEPPARVGGVTALQGAAIRGDMQLVRFLLAKGANINAPGSPVEGRTALEGAAEHGRIEMLRYLLSKGAMPDPVTGYARAIELAKKELHFGIANFLREEQRKLGEMGFLGIDLDSL